MLCWCWHDDSLRKVQCIICFFHPITNCTLPLQASLYTDIESYRPFRTPYYDLASKSVSRLKPASSDTASSGSLTIKAIDEPLQCDKDTPISIKYTFTGETFNTDSVDIIYMVRGSQITLWPSKIIKTTAVVRRC